MEIRSCRAVDVAVLERWQPTGLTQVHAARFGRQREGASTFLVDWGDGGPVGSCEVRWVGCAAEEVRARYPGCPEINGLQVWPAELQSRGIGRALVAAAEDEARRRGCTLIGLGVADGNPRAAELYDRLGYADGGCPYFDRYSRLDGGGGRHDVVDPCRFLVKRVCGD